MFHELQSAFSPLKIMQNPLVLAEQAIDPEKALLGNDDFLIVLAQVLPVFLLFIALKPTEESRFNGKIAWIAVITYAGGLVEILILVALYAATNVDLPNVVVNSLAGASIVLILVVLIIILGSPLHAASKRWYKRSKQVDQQQDNEDDSVTYVSSGSIRIGILKIQYEKKTERDRHEPSGQHDM